MPDDTKDKVGRVLTLYTKLINGYAVNKAEEAERYGVAERSIQRDIDDIRSYMEQETVSSGVVNSVIYDRNIKAYRLEKIYQLKLTNAEVLAICKILLDSRSLTKAEMTNILDKLIDCCVPKANQKRVQDLIRNEEFHYIQPRHGKVFIDKLWDIGRAIQESRYIEIQYKGMQGSTVKTRKLKPLAIMFSEYYFYMAATIDDESVRENFSVLNDMYPTIYRIDRLRGLKVLDERFKIPYKDRFEEGEYRKRIQFMWGGKLRKVRFKYSGWSVESVLDRLPTAVIEHEEPGDNGHPVYTISAEVFGDGIDMWLRGQGDIKEVF